MAELTQAQKNHLGSLGCPCEVQYREPEGDMTGWLILEPFQLWIVGRVHYKKEWEFIGVYSNEQRAVAACTTDWHFVGPVTLNETLPDGPGSWPGSYFPMLIDAAAEEGQGKE